MRSAAVLLTLLGLLLAGCGRTPFPTLQAKLDALKGQPIKTVTDALGEPNEVADVGDEKSYKWTLTTNLGAAYSLVAFRCEIVVFAGKDDAITHSAYDGNNGGCSRYAEKLDSGYHFL